MFVDALYVRPYKLSVPSVLTSTCMSLVTCLSLSSFVVNLSSIQVEARFDKNVMTLVVSCCVASSLCLVNGVIIPVTLTFKIRTERERGHNAKIVAATQPEVDNRFLKPERKVRGGTLTDSNQAKTALSELAGFKTEDHAGSGQNTS